MFTAMDIDHMGQRGIKLNDYAYMSDATGSYAHATDVYDQVSSGSMPPSWSGEQPWTTEMVATYKQWMIDGYQP